MKRVILAILLAVFLPRAAEAQRYLIDGTAPGAQTLKFTLPDLSAEYNQSFVAIGSKLSRISIWFYGGETNSPTVGMDYLAQIYLERIDSYAPSLGVGVTIPQTTQGRFDYTFASPITLSRGETYLLNILTTNCYDREEGGCFGKGPPVGPTERLHQIEMTTGNAYAHGSILNAAYDPSIEPDHDLRFELAFVPEPPSPALLGIGLMVILGVARRRRSPSLR